MQHDGDNGVGRSATAENDYLADDDDGNFADSQHKTHSHTGANATE
jgi:hypothetical protein